jgi:hypothetical protein
LFTVKCVNVDYVFSGQVFAASIRYTSRTGECL